MPDVPPGAVTVTSTAPEPAGEVAVIEVAELTVKELAAVDPNATAVAPVRLVPLIVTTVPPVTGPAAGATAVTLGGEVAPAADANQEVLTVEATTAAPRIRLVQLLRPDRQPQWIPSRPLAAMSSPNVGSPHAERADGESGALRVNVLCPLVVVHKSTRGPIGPGSRHRKDLRGAVGQLIRLEFWNLDLVKKETTKKDHLKALHLGVGATLRCPFGIPIQ